ncbi:hypothetical protein VTO73DRAFT_10990 [Trametes versicolor]
MHYLNLDVLALICDSAYDVSTVLHFSLASHSFRAIAVKRLLSMRPVALNSERSVRAFHKFVFADPRSRLPFLRALNIGVPGPPPWGPVGFDALEPDKAPEEVVQFILDIIDRATHLTSLTLPHPRWTFAYLSDPRIPEAIARISTLRQLALIDSCLREQCPMVKRIVNSTRSASTLRVLRISLDLTMLIPGLLVRGGHAIKATALDALLSHLAPTLQVLHIISSRCLQLDAKGVEYPALRSLICMAHVVGEHGRDVDTDILVSKFPALDGTLLVHLWKPYDETEEDVTELRRIRASNEERQKKRSWRHLDRVFASNVLSLFAMGLACPVRYLMVEDLASHTRDYMVEILRATPPTHLKLSVKLCYGAAVFQGLFPPEVISRLTHLVLLLEYVDEPETLEEATVEWKPLLAEIIDSIRSLRLTHLRLSVRYNIDEISRGVTRRKSFVQAIDNARGEKLASELMDAVPSLQYVFVSAGGHFEAWPDDYPAGACAGKRVRPVVHSAWKNMRIALRPSASPRKIEEDVMRQILLDEELTLSETDIVSDVHFARADRV